MRKNNLKWFGLLIRLLLLVWILQSCEKSPTDQNYKSFHPNVNSAIIGGELESNSILQNIIFKQSLAGAYRWGFCTAFKLDSGLVLSATHCYEPLIKSGSPLTSISIQLSKSNNDFFAQQMRAISLDPRFNSEESFANDLTALFSGTKIKNDGVGFLLPKKNQKLPETLYASGYGIQIYDKSDLDLSGFLKHELKTLSVYVKKQRMDAFDPETIRQQFCSDYKGIEQMNCLAYADKAVEVINENLKSQKMICFESPDPATNGVIFGDSGGPLYGKNKDGSYTVFGVFSQLLYNNKKNITHYCYTNLTQYLDWINDQSEKYRANATSELTVSFGGRSTKIDNMVAYPKKVRKAIEEEILSIFKSSYAIDEKIKNKFALINPNYDGVSEATILNIYKNGAKALVVYSVDYTASFDGIPNFEIDYKKIGIPEEFSVIYINAEDGQQLKKAFDTGYKPTLKLSY